MSLLNLTRRNFISALGAGSVLPALGWANQSLAANEVLNVLNAESDDSVSPESHFLARCSYGINPGSLQRIEQLGIADYLEEQLNWQALDDSTTDSWLNQHAGSLNLPDCDLMTADARVVGNELIEAKYFRAVYSERQLYELMVDFWSDHFNIFQNQSGPLMLLKTKDESQVIRPHALGFFRDMLSASMHSPAMLIYLDNWKNVHWGPNENYARELLELHTLGVDGGYSEQDVKEVARCLTGWSVSLSSADWPCSSNDGGFRFFENLHDPGTKTVLGQSISNSGIGDGQQVLDLLMAHPSTARYLATKLCRYFVSDSPSSTLVNNVANAFGANGDIKAMLRALLLSDEFANAPRTQYRRPMQYACAALRALGTTSDSTAMIYLKWLISATGHTPYQWPTPDGYPHEAEYWINTHGNLIRWQFAMLMAMGKHNNGSPHALSLAPNATTLNELVDTLSSRLLGHRLSTAQRHALAAYVSYGRDHDAAINSYHLNLAATYMTALLMSSAHFQVH